MSKTIVYPVTFVICFLLQIAVAPAIQINGCMPNFLVIPVVLVSLRSGYALGSLTGFLLGLLQDFSGSATVGCMALTYVLLAVIIGIIGSAIDTSAPLVACVVVLCACVFAELGYAVSVLLSSADNSGVLSMLVSYSLPSALYSTLFGCIAIITIGLVLADENPAATRLGANPIGGSPGKMPRMKSRLK